MTKSLVPMVNLRPSRMPSSGSAPDPRLPYTFVPTRTTIPTTIPTPLLPLRTTTTRPTVSQDPLPSSTRGGQVMSTSEPLSCVECPGSSFPLGFGIGIATGLLLGVILSAGILAIYCIKNKRKLQRDGGHTVAYNDGIYLTPQGSSSPSNPTQGQSPTEINHYASLGNTLPPQATVYEPLKLYENYKK